MSVCMEVRLAKVARVISWKIRISGRKPKVSREGFEPHQALKPLKQSGSPLSRSILSKTERFKSKTLVILCLILSKMPAKTNTNLGLAAFWRGLFYSWLAYQPRIKKIGRVNATDIFLFFNFTRHSSHSSYRTRKRQF